MTLIAGFGYVSGSRIPPVARGLKGGITAATPKNMVLENNSERSNRVFDDNTNTDNDGGLLYQHQHQHQRQVYNYNFL